MKRVFLAGVVVFGLVCGAIGAEYYTERFFSGQFDLEGMSITFTPDGSADYYSASAELITALPVNPSSHVVIGLGDDTAEFTSFSENGSKSFEFYGVRKYGCYIGSNGYITLDAEGDSDYTASIPEHFNTPRISTFYDDWNPVEGGEILLGYLGDRFVVTFYEIQEFGSTSTNTGTFQTEIFYNSGVIRMSWLDLNPSTISGVVGLSSGGGTPADFVESDLSTFAFDLDKDGIWDVWETAFFSHYTNCQPTANFDGDNLDNISEYICGSNPLDPNSYFYCLTANTPAGPVVAWPSLEGRKYTVMKSADLVSSPFTPYQSDIAYSDNVFTDTVSSATAFYKVEVELTE